jgi:predicted ATPase
MLTRLRVSGFKNLVDVDVRFGPFTCIAGANGVGKSNLLDAIVFLSALAGHPLMDAALSVRDEGGRSGDVRSLFHHVGNDYVPEMTFEAEMLVSDKALDDLGQEASATSTLLKYEVTLRHRLDTSTPSIGALELTKEQLSHITLGEARKHLLFPHSTSWRRPVLKSHRFTPFFISTDEAGFIRVHQDGGSSGRARTLVASNLPRTTLSAANAAESPTATVARREMQSWRLLQLEPSSLRRSDNFTAPFKLATDGAHLPATLYHLARSRDSNGTKSQASLQAEMRIYANVANTLAELIDDVRSVRVDRDERRELLTLYVTGKDGTPHAARALSDGTLRFLALAVLALDPHETGVLCLEEPENGIHPARIPAMIRLLEDLATDVREPVGPENPLRQVIVNTHSPAVVQQVPDESLMMAELIDNVRDGKRFKSLTFRCLPGTWREKAAGAPIIARGNLLDYLNPAQPIESDDLESDGSGDSISKPRRVIDRHDLQQFFPFDEQRD